MHNYELQVQKDYAEVFAAVYLAAEDFGYVITDNLLMGYIHFKKKLFSLSGIPARYIVAIKKVDEQTTEIKMQVQPTIGYASFVLNQKVANKAYTEFLDKLSEYLNK